MSSRHSHYAVESAKGSIMPAASNINLQDGQATPVTHTFVPLGPDTKDATIFWYEDQSAATPIGNWKLSIQMLRPTSPKSGESSVNRTIRVKVGLHQPVLETMSNSTASGIVPAPQLAYISRGFLEYVIPERASLNDRKNLSIMMMNLAGNTVLYTTIVQNLQMVY